MVNKQILELTFSNKKCIEQLQVITKSKIVPLCPLPSISVLQILFRYQLRVRRSQKQAKFKSKITLVNRYFYSYWKSGCFGKNEASVKYWLLGHTDPYNKKKQKKKKNQKKTVSLGVLSHSCIHVLPLAWHFHQESLWWERQVFWHKAAVYFLSTYCNIHKWVSTLIHHRLSLQCTMQLLQSQMEEISCSRSPQGKAP